MTNLKINKVMTVEELLMPRYKVIADYPSSPYYVGEIKDRLGDNVAAHFAKYPHLFRKLNWWEERKVEDMPEYVKYHNGSISLLTKDMIDAGGIVLEDYLPTTEQQYNDYINSKSNAKP